MENQTGIRILLVEDLSSDIELTERALKKEDVSYELIHVDTEEKFRKALDEFIPDIVISDYALPGFDGMQVIKITMDKDPSLPVIIVTGSMNEETAVECMKAGAGDYVIKEHIKRLPFAIKDVLEKKQVQSEKQKIQQALNESEHLFKSLINSMLDGLLILDWDGTVMFANNAAGEILGYGDKVLRMNVFDFLHPNETDRVSEHLNSIKSGKGILEDYRIILPDGEEHWVQTHGTKVQYRESDADLVTFRDITDQKKAERTLHKRTSDLRERIKELNCIYKVTSLILDIERSTEEIVYEILDILPKSLRYPDIACARITLHDKEYRTGNFRRSSNNISANITVEHNSIGFVELFYLENPRSENEGLFLKQEIRLIESVAGHLAHFIERKQTGNELRKLYNLFKETETISKVGGWEYDIETEETTWTDQVYIIFGVDTSFNPSDIIHERKFYTPESADRIKAAFRRAVKHGEPYDLEIEIIQPDGTKVWSRNIGKPVIENGRLVRIVGNIMDITDRKLLESQILQTQKLESIGKLAGGVAHDLNNVLGAIMGHADLGRRKISPQNPLYNRLDKILNLTERGARITQQMLAFSRRQDIEPRNVNLNVLVSDLLKLLGKTLGEHINIKFKPEQDLRTISVDPGQIDQVLMNLCINARDAMPDGGDLLINTSNIDIDKDYARYHVDAKEGKYIVLSVSDTGTGIPAEYVQKVFDPFFTTKEPGKGTGLGLSVVHGIVGQHKGFVNVYSEFGIGTTFNIYLPAVEGEPDAGVSEELEEIPRGSGTILVVEDDEDILSMIQSILEYQGYTGLIARDGDEAFNLFNEKKDEIKLIVSDVVMPKLSGRELYEKIKLMSPEIPFLFISGYTAEMISRRFIDEEGVAFIAKPFRTSEFGRKITEILNT